MQTKKFLSNLAIKRLFRKIGGRRVSTKACLELQKEIEEYVALIGKLAIKNAVYEGRKGIKDKDIKEAVKEMKEKEQF